MPNRMDKSMMNSPYYAGYNKGKAAKPQYPYPAAGVRAYAPPVGSPYKQSQGANARPKPPQQITVPLSPKEQRKLKKAQKRNRSHFFVMRRGISFCLFVCFFLYIVVIAVSCLNVPFINGYVSLLTVPDNTSYTERWEYEKIIGDDGYYQIYQDKSEYVAAIDPIMGFIDQIIEMLGTKPAEAAEDEAEEETPVTESPAPEPVTKQYYGDFLKLMEDRQSDFDITPKIAYLIFKFFPAALMVAALTALIAVFTSFGAARGKRIHKGFALAALIMLIAGVATLAAGYALSNVVSSNSMGPFDFANIQSFLLRGVTGPPYSPEASLATPPLQLVSGYLTLVLMILPVLILILSIFCRKRVPYKIFDK